MDITNNAGTAPDGDGILGGPNEIINYNYDAGNLYVTRKTNCTGGDQPFLGESPANIALGKPRDIRVVNDINGNGVYDAGVDVPVFRYYDGLNAEILPASLPAGIPSIRMIEITLVTETENIDPSTRVRRRLIYSTRVIPRNHAINP
jgi:hypothetical protein